MGKYKFIKRIGEGGFGFVDLVEDENGQQFARKTFTINNVHFPKALEGNARDRFKRETRVQKQILHPNIIPVLDFDLNVDPPFYIMPLAICSLQDDIVKDKTLGGRYLNAMFDITN